MNKLQREVYRFIKSSKLYFQLQNMSRFKFLFLLLLTGISASAVQSFRQNSHGKLKNTPVVMVVQNDPYEKEWQMVDSLDKKGLPESALTEVKKIYALAQKDQNGPQIIKSMIFIMKYHSHLKEDDYVIALNDLNKMAEESASPQKQVIHSIIAEVYWGYYQSNRYKFYGRTETLNFKNEDIRTWDLNTLSKKIVFHYLQSVQEQQITKSISVESYKDIYYENPDSRKIRPTLFDFLVHRAIDFFKSTEFDVTRPAYTFRIDKKEYFGNGEVFFNEQLSTKDSLSTKYFALKLMQQAGLFHKNDESPEAIIPLELERLAFVRNYSTLPEKDTLYYAALINLREKHKAHKVSSEIDYCIASVHSEIGNLYNPLDPETEQFKWQKRKALQICEETIKKFPDAYGSLQCKALISQLQSKTLTVTIEDIIASDHPSHILVESKSLKKIYFRLIKTGWDYNIRDYNESTEEYLNRLIALPVYKQWSKDLQDDADLQQHRMELLLPALPKGAYMLLASSNEKFSYKEDVVTWTPVGVSNLSYTERKNHDDETYDFAVFDRISGNPLKGVKAQIYYREYNYTRRKYENKKGESYLSDENGMFKVKQTGKDYRYMYIDLTTKDDRLNSDQQYYQYRPYRERQENVTTYFFTDRKIYRPGQTIYFKGIRIATDKNGENPVLRTNESASVTLYDFNYQEVTTLNVKTNEYGTYSGSFIAPVGLMNGSMHFTDGYGSSYISVEEYKRPKFEVGFDEVKGAYKLGQVIKIKGHAKAYAGSVVDQAKVSYRVTRNVYFPYYYYNYWYSGRRFNNQQTEIAFGETITSEDGTFEISFPALADESIAGRYKPAFNFTITADVTDISGETRSSSTNVNVGYTAMVLTLNVPDQLKTSFKKKFPVKASNLNGSPVNTSGKIEIHRLQQPERVMVERRLQQADRHELSKEAYYSTFPHEQYADENNMQNWAKEKKVFEMTFDTRKKDSLDLKELSEWTPGHYLIEASATDSFGVEVKEQKIITLINENSSKMHFSSPFEVIALNSKTQPGEKAAFLLASKWKNAMVLVEREEKGQIVSREWITLSDEQKKIEVPVEEKHRGNFGMHFTLVKNNRFFHSSHVVSVPFTNKEMDIEFLTFRNKILPGSEEEWKMKIKGKKGEKLAAELLLTMYDASLDAFAANYMYLQPYKYYYAGKSWNGQFGFATRTANTYDYAWNKHFYHASRQFDVLNWFGYQTYYYGPGYARYYRSSKSKDNYDGDVLSGTYAADMEVAESVAIEEKSVSKKAEGSVQVSANTVTMDANLQQKNGKEASGKEADKGGESNNTEDLGNVKARTNLNETAFFYPHLETDEEGNVLVKFTAPEALTRWKILGLAHTKDLMIGTVEKELITQKDLMVLPNAPRFFRENDKIALMSKISNVSDKDLEGSAQLFLLDPITQKPLDAAFGNKTPQVKFAVKKGASTVVAWELRIPEGITTVSYRIVAKAGTFSDGEEMAVPVLTNSMLVTESLPLPIRKAGSKNFNFTKLTNSGSSKTLRHHKLTLEFTSNPAWYAIQAMPYMMEYPYECAEQVFTRFYSNSIAFHVMNSSPKIKAVVEQWKNASPDAFLSNLEKNQELKSLMLEETPWVLDAQNETERKKRIALLFDFNRMGNELNTALRKLQKMQSSNGGWPWFQGMPESRYITQHIVTGMGRLDKLGIKNIRNDKATWNMVKDAVRYLDIRLVEDYQYIKKNYKNYLTEQYISYEVIQYLYARSYFPDIEIKDALEEALLYYKNQAKTYWLNFNLYAQGMLALGADRFEMKSLSGDIVKSIREKSIRHEELGMYWKDNTIGYHWYQAPVETHALLMEMFDEVANDQESVEELKVWLLKNKQTSDWKTTKATADACYALLLRGTDVLSNDEMVEIKLGNETIDPKKAEVKAEAGTGYFKTSWSGEHIRPEMGKVTLTKKNNGVAWGALYWQYFEQLDKITTHETPLKLNKKLFLVNPTEAGPKMSPVDEKTKLIPGSRVRVRIELRVDRAMEYVHMKDMRASCFEPVNVFSRYKWQDGLGYFENTRDAATNFFFDYLPKGTHVFEYDLLVAHSGDFSNGITTIQCMYAPEFTSHSEGVRVLVRAQ